MLKFDNYYDFKNSILNINYIMGKHMKAIGVHKHQWNISAAFSNDCKWHAPFHEQIDVAMTSLKVI